MDIHFNSTLPTRNNINLNEIVRDQFFVLRALFYLLTPNETYIEHVEDVPDLTKKVH